MKSHPSPIVTRVLAIPRPAKRGIVLLVDASFCMLTVWLALCLRLGALVQLSGNFWWPVVISMLIALPIFIVFGLYRAIFRYSGLPAVLAVSKAMAIHGLVFFVVFAVLGIEGVPRAIGIVQPFLLLLAVAATRAGARFWLGGTYQNQLRVAAIPAGLIFGAGTSGRHLAAMMDRGQEVRVIGFLDDDERLHGQVLNGLPIFSPADLSGLVSTFQVQTVLLAMPCIGRHRRNEILASLELVSVRVRTISDEQENAVPYSCTSLAELGINDILGDSPIASNHILQGKNITGKTVLVTGAGGFVGQAICRQIVSMAPDILLMIEQSESSLDQAYRALQSARPLVKLVPLLASVRDEERMAEVISTWRPATIYHAAASKHVDLIEHNPAEGIKNNVLGTLTPALAAIDYCVADFVLVSTEQATRPTNSMGASKRLAELILLGLTPIQNTTRFSCVRLGEIFDPSTSILAQLRGQIRSGESVLTISPRSDQSMMTVMEAAQLLIQAGALGKGGYVFSVDTGRRVNWRRFAERVIAFSGHTLKSPRNPDGEFDIAVPEPVSMHSTAQKNPNLTPTLHPCIFKNEHDHVSWPVLKERIATLEIALNLNDVALVRHVLGSIIVGYVPDGEIVDWVHVEASAIGKVEQ